MKTRNFRCSKCFVLGTVTLFETNKEYSVRCYGTEKNPCGHINTFAIHDTNRIAVAPMAPR